MFYGPLTAVQGLQMLGEIWAMNLREAGLNARLMADLHNFVMVFLKPSGENNLFLIFSNLNNLQEAVNASLESC